MNSSAVNILWGSPWPNNYTLTISNSMTNTTLFIITIIANSVIITKDIIDDCTLLYATVIANTDIGSNEVSDSRIFGFPKCKFTLILILKNINLFSALELIETSRIAKYINTTSKDYIFINIGVIVSQLINFSTNRLYRYLML